MLQLDFRFRACFMQRVPWHSGNYRVWIHSETCMWHDKNIRSTVKQIWKPYQASKIYRAFLTPRNILMIEKKVETLYIVYQVIQLSQYTAFHLALQKVEAASENFQEVLKHIYGFMSLYSYISLQLYWERNSLPAIFNELAILSSWWLLIEKTEKQYCSMTDHFFKKEKNVSLGSI